MTTLLSRKHLLGRAALVTGGAIVAGGVVASAAGAPAELVAYQLDPDCCQGCNACRKHALNTLFASAAAADLFRAHPYCKCAVVEGPMLPYDTWVALFGPPGRDRPPERRKRTSWVADVLAASSVPASVPPASAAGSAPDASGSAATPPAPPTNVSPPTSPSPPAPVVVGAVTHR